MYAYYSDEFQNGWMNPDETFRFKNRSGFSETNDIIPFQPFIALNQTSPKSVITFSIQLFLLILYDKQFVTMETKQQLFLRFTTYSK